MFLRTDKLPQRFKRRSRRISTKEINSYNDFIDVYEQASKKILNTQKRPNHWGGYSFRPYYFEFWQGHNLRINKREAFIFEKDVWKNIFLQP